MFYRATIRRLKELGIIGINRRNLDYLLELNCRSLYPLVDDKEIMAQLATRFEIPIPQIFDIIHSPQEIHHIKETLAKLSSCVLKPANGCGGRGIWLLEKRNKSLLDLSKIDQSSWVRPNSETVAMREVENHAIEVISGGFSITGQPDRLLIQERITLHPFFAKICPIGIPDIRIVVKEQEPIMAMLRLPTFDSEGRANLHQKALGVGIDLDTGISTLAIYGENYINTHPDTGKPISQLRIPHWNEFLNLAIKIARVTNLGFLGVDCVLDPNRGPLLLEANARPGLMIQWANGIGFLKLSEWS